MATEKELMDRLINVRYSFSDRYGLSYLLPKRHSIIENTLSELRHKRIIDGEEYRLLHLIFKHQFDNYYKVKYLESIEPRLIAQQFIGKRNVREFIFKRDNYRCLRCSSKINLTLDHIVPINKNGTNKLSNLQTLCKSCNSKKSTKIIDYR